MAAAAEDSEGCAALREAACGVLAAMLQNNPPVQAAARVGGIGGMLLRLLGDSDGEAREDGWEARVGGLAVVRKALLALSAFLRGDEGGATGEEGVAMVTLAMPTISELTAHADAKLRRRALFLLASLAAEAEAAARDAIFLHACATGTALPAALVAALQSEDEDIRTQAARFTGAASNLQSSGASCASSAAALAGLMVAAGAVEKVRQALITAEAADAERDPEEVGRLRNLLSWLEAA